MPHQDPFANLRGVSRRMEAERRMDMERQRAHREREDRGKRSRRREE